MHGIAGPRTIVHQILEIIGQTPNHAKIRHPQTRQKNGRHLCCRKLVLPEKWTKVQQNNLRAATHQYPYRCEISSSSAERCTIKTLRNSFTSFSILAPQGWGQSSPAPAQMYNNAPLPICQCRPLLIRDGTGRDFRDPTRPDW